MWICVCGIVLSLAIVAGLSILAGLLVTRVLIHVKGSHTAGFVPFLRATGRAGSQRPRSWARSSPAVSCCPSSRVLRTGRRGAEAVACRPHSSHLPSASNRAPIARRRSSCIGIGRPCTDSATRCEASSPRDTRQHRSRSTAGSPCSPPLVSPTGEPVSPSGQSRYSSRSTSRFARMYRGIIIRSTSQAAC